MKRLYHMLALLAMVNLFAVTGLLGFLLATGRVDAQKFDRIAMVLRDEWPETPVAATQPAETDTLPKASREEIARAQARKEYYELLAERHKREIEDRRALDLEIQLETVRMLDLIERKEKAFKAEQANAREESRQLGFERRLEVLSKIEPDKAKELLLVHTKEADTVQLLMQMDENRVSKIVNACETPEEKLWIGGILNQIGTYGNEPANDVDGSIASANEGS